MATPRSEAIVKARSGSSDIRPSLHKDSLENKIDHYAVLSQVINNGISDYLENPPENSQLYNARSLNDLSAALRGEVSDTIIQTLLSDTFKDHFDSLHESQMQRHAMDTSKWDDLMLNILAGTTTFVQNFSSIFSILQRHYGVEVASHPDNWRIADRLAKLEIHQLSAYTGRYLHEFRNWPEMIEHIDVSSDGSAEFKAGYPGDARIFIAAQYLSTPQDNGPAYNLDGTPVLVPAQLKDMDTSATIGCPVTFSPKIIKELWGVYTSHAHRILTEPAIGGSEASHRQTSERSQQLYRRLAQSMPSAHLEHQIRQSGH